MEDKLNYSSILSSRAQKEIAISWNWYEERQQGLGDRFVKEVITRIRDIEKTPDRYPTRYKTYKEILVPSFPFLIIYRIIKTKKSIRVVSVFHTSQSPKKKPY
jgi:plasmid stabilization system protein ParE